MQICVLVSALLVAAFMVLLQVPGTSSAVLLPFLLLLWGATFPLAVLAQVGRHMNSSSSCVLGGLVTLASSSWGSCFCAF